MGLPDYPYIHFHKNNLKMYLLTMIHQASENLLICCFALHYAFDHLIKNTENVLKIETKHTNHLIDVDVEWQLICLMHMIFADMFM